MNNEPYINAAGHLVLEYISDDTIVLDLHFIMTTGKRLTRGMPYLKLANKNIGEDRCNQAAWLSRLSGHHLS